jgi:hypothetical protein
LPHTPAGSGVDVAERECVGDSDDVVLIVGVLDDVRLALTDLLDVRLADCACTPHDSAAMASTHAVMIKARVMLVD